MFERDGFLTARISDIASGAGTSHGSFYHYFDSKEEIFREVAAKQEVSWLSAQLIHDDERSDPIEWIRRSNRAYLEAYQTQAKIMRVIEEVSRYDADVNRVREARQRDFGESLSRSIVRLQERGLADPGLDPHLTATVLGAMIARVSEMIFVQHYSDVGVDTLTDEITRIWSSALGLKTTDEHVEVGEP